MGFLYFYAASKLAAVGMLGAASKACGSAAWLAAECMVLLVVRKCAAGSWRFYQNNAMHGFGFSLFANVCRLYDFTAEARSRCRPRRGGRDVVLFVFS